MTKRKKIHQNNIQIIEENISNKKKSKFEVILLFFIAAPFIILTLIGNVDTSSSRSGNQSLTNSWQNVSPAFSNKSSVLTVAPTPKKLLPINTINKLKKQ